MYLEYSVLTLYIQMPFKCVQDHARKYPDWDLC